MRGFAPALPLFTQLVTLNLDSNNLADEGVELLAKWLPAPVFHSLSDRSFQYGSRVCLFVNDCGIRHCSQTITTLPTSGHFPVSFGFKFKECFENTSVGRPRNFCTLLRSVPVREYHQRPPDEIRSMCQFVLVRFLVLGLKLSSGVLLRASSTLAPSYQHGQQVYESHCVPVVATSFLLFLLAIASVSSNCGKTRST